MRSIPGSGNRCLGVIGTRPPVEADDLIGVRTIEVRDRLAGHPLATDKILIRPHVFDLHPPSYTLHFRAEQESSDFATLNFELSSSRTSAYLCNQS